MLKHTKALTWEYFGECWWSLVGMLAMLILGPMAFRGIIGAFGVESLQSAEQRMDYFFSFLGCAAFAYSVPHFQAVQETSKRTLVAPVSSRYLVTFMMSMTIAAVMLSNLVTQAFYLFVMGVQWPVLTTTFSLGAFTSLVLAALWWIRDFRFHRLFIIASAVTAWIFWLLRHYVDSDFRGPVHSWTALSAIDIVVLIGTVVVSWGVMLRGFVRYRCGEADGRWMFLDVPLRELTNLRRQASKASDAPVLSTTPREALGILNWDGARAVAIGVGGCVGLLMGLTGLLALWGKAGNPLKGMVAMLTIFSAMTGMLAGGQFIWVTKTGGMRTFLSTMPVSDRDYGRVLLRDSMKSSICSWGAIFLMFVGLILVHLGLNGFEKLKADYSGLFMVKRFGHWAIPGLIAGTIILNWIFTGMMGTLTSTGRIYLMVTFWIVVYSVIVTVMLLSGLGGYGSHWADRAANAVVVSLSTVVGGFGTIVLFALALKRQLVTWQQSAGAVITVLILSAILLTVLPVSPLWKIVWCCGACVVVAPVAAIPCALQWNRHR